MSYLHNHTPTGQTYCQRHVLKLSKVKENWFLWLKHCYVGPQKLTCSVLFHIASSSPTELTIMTSCPGRERGQDIFSRHSHRVIYQESKRQKNVHMFYRHFFEANLIFLWRVLPLYGMLWLKPNEKWRRGNDCYGGNSHNFLDIWNQMLFLWLATNHHVVVFYVNHNLKSIYSWDKCRGVRGTIIAFRNAISRSTE